MALSVALQHLTVLHTLHLSNNGFDPTAATALASALQRVTSLTSLDARGQDMGDGVWAVIATLLPRAARLQVDSDGGVVVGIGAEGISRMTLSGGKGLGRNGALRLADLLLQAPLLMLAELVLVRNDIDSDCVTALTAPLAKLTSLQSLDLRGNRLGVAGWASVAEALARGTRLTSLNGCGQYAAIREGGLQELKLDKKWELGMWAVRFLERSESTLTRLDAG